MGAPSSPFPPSPTRRPPRPLVGPRLLAGPPVAPQPLTELRAADLAADRLGQLGHEVDLPGVLVRRGQPPGVLLKLAGQLLAGLVARPQDAERGDDLGS